MNRLNAVGFVAPILGAAGVIVWKFSFWMLVRLILSLGFLGITLMLGFFLALTAYARSWKYALYLLIPVVLSGYATYLCITWQNLEIVGGIIALFALGLIGFVWYISEPDLGLVDRFKSAERLEREGNYRAAARKYEKKAGNVAKAAECLEKYAEQESWFWEDVAKMDEELGDNKKAREAWQKALEYYVNEAQEEGVFWEDVGKIHAKLGDEDKAKEAYQKFLEYCLKEAENDEMWWKHVAETYEILGEKEKAEEAWERYENYRKKIVAENTSIVKQ